MVALLNYMPEIMASLLNYKVTSSGFFFSFWDFQQGHFNSAIVQSQTVDNDHFRGCFSRFFLYAFKLLFLQIDDANVFKETKQFTYKDGAQFVFMDLVLLSIHKI